MTRDKPLYAILGPCACQGCGTRVWWARSQTRIDGQTVKGTAWWREQGGRMHRCQLAADKSRALKVRAA